MNKVAIYTFGCKLNQYETAVIREMFLARDFKIVKFSEKADVYVINSCSVTNRADYKSREFIRKANKINPDAIFIVIGCSVENYPEKLKKINFIDYLVGTGDKLNFFRENIPYLKKQSETVLLDNQPPESNNPTGFRIEHFLEHTRAFIKVQDGCNYNCSYCCVRLARGKSRSRNPEEIISEVNTLIKNGYREIVLTGVNLGLFGKDLDRDIDFTKLIRLILDSTFLERLRISSIDPDDLDDDFIKLFSHYPERLAPHLHISMQSLSDTVLKRMNRRNSAQDIKNLVSKLKQIQPDINIGGDIIVGFPGETDDEFNETLIRLSDWDINYFHVFSYSIRENTPAAVMKPQVNGTVKNQRSRTLKQLDKNKRKKFIEQFLNKPLRFLIEKRLTSTGDLIGVSGNYISAKFPGKKNNEKLYNIFVKGRITNSDPVQAEIIK